jgi:hypothetical protein
MQGGSQGLEFLSVGQIGFEEDRAPLSKLFLQNFLNFLRRFPKYFGDGAQTEVRP